MIEACGEVCPEDSTFTCSLATHRFGEHCASAWDPATLKMRVKTWSGNERPLGGERRSPERDLANIEKVKRVEPGRRVGPPTAPPFSSPLAGSNDPENAHIAAARFEPERGTREREVLDYLRARLGEWVDGLELSTAEVGGAQGLKRFRDLRLHGWDVENRPNPDTKTTWQYRLRSMDVAAPEPEDSP